MCPDSITSLDKFHQSSLEFSSPPISNRGGKPEFETKAGVDWLAYTISAEFFTDCWELISRYYPLELSVKNPVACAGYREVTEFQDGPKVSYSSDRPEIHIQFSGRVINMLLLGRQIAMIRDFQALGAKCTRIDLKLDDCRQLVTPAHMDDWARQGYLCRFRRWELKEAFVSIQSLGQTFVAGRRGKNGSGCYFRCYEWYLNEEGIKQNGRNADGFASAIRFECEFTQHKSRAVCDCLAGGSSDANSEQTIRELVLGSIDFRRGDSQGSFRDRNRVEGWEAYVHGIFPCKFVRPKRIVTEGFPVAAFSKQWGNKLAAFLQSRGFGAFSNALSYSVAEGVRRGHGMSLPAEKIVVLKKSLVKMFPNLDHTRRYCALLAQADLGA